MKASLQSRRNILQKTAFVVPTMITLKLTELKAHASGNDVIKKNEVFINNQSKNNHKPNGGNHYGNNRPDMNPTDNKNKHNGINNIRNQ